MATTARPRRRTPLRTGEGWAVRRLTADDPSAICGVSSCTAPATCLASFVIPPFAAGQPAHRGMPACDVHAASFAARHGLPGWSGLAIVNRFALAAVLPPPLHPVIDLDHVTWRYPDVELAPAPDVVLVTGIVADVRVQALTVTVDGTTTAPDGRILHITYSLAPGVHPKDSSRLLAAAAPLTFPTPFPIPVTPFWRPATREETR